MLREKQVILGPIVPVGMVGSLVQIRAVRPLRAILNYGMVCGEKLILPWRVTTTLSGDVWCISKLFVIGMNS